MNCKYFKLVLWTVAASFLFAACDSNIELGNEIDESAYGTIFENNSWLRDAGTSRNSNVAELYGETYQTSLKVGVTQAPASAITATVAFDAAYLEIYNAEHGTSYELYPAENVMITGDGVVTIPAGAYESAEVGVTIAAAASLDADKTYLVPISIVSATGTEIKDDATHCVYLVKDRRSLGNCFKGDDLPRGILILQVGDTNPLNALSFELENGKLLWDAVVLFASNINYHATEKRPYLNLTSKVQFLLANRETYVEPLRKRGIKVLLGILGNRDAAGLAQLSEAGARDFAQEVANVCNTYGLDGVFLDDEYASEPDLNNPAFTEHGQQAAARMCYESKRAMPDKLVGCYQYGPMPGVPSVDGVDADEYLDIMVPDYGSGCAGPIGNMSYKKCAAVSIEFNLGHGSLGLGIPYIEKYGCGWFMGFASDPSHFTNDFGVLYKGCEQLYGVSLKAPTTFYKKDDPTPYVYPDDL